MDTNDPALQDIAKAIAQAFANVTLKEAFSAMVNKTPLNGFYVESLDWDHAENLEGRITRLKLRRTTSNITVEIDDWPS